MTEKPWAILCSKGGLSHIYGRYAQRSEADQTSRVLSRRLPNFSIEVIWDGEVSA